MGRLVAWIRGLVSDLRRRRVFRAGAMYVVAAWIALQVAAIVFSALYFPDWALTVLVVVAAAGLPVTLAAAWAFDVTPEGIRRTEAAEGPDAFPAASPAVRVTLFALVLLVSGGGGWLTWAVWLRPAATGEPDRNAAAVDARPALEPTRLAVLYFDNPSGGTELAAVARGLTEDLTHELSQVEALDVVSRNAVKPYRDGSVSLDSIARDLEAGTLVEGSVERSGGDLVVTVQLIDASSGTHIASERVRRSGEDLFEVRQAVVEDVVRTLRRRLGEEIRVASIRRVAPSEEAWKLLYAGREAMDDAAEALQTGAVEAGRRLLVRADSLFGRAEAMDAGWVEPTVRRAWAALQLATTAGVSVRQWDRDAIREGIRHANRALEKEPDAPDALEARGTLRYRLAQASGGEEAGRLETLARSDLERAVADGPEGRARAWTVLGDLYRSHGRFDEARMAARRSREADPYLYHEHQYLFLVAHLALELEDPETARRLTRRGRALFPENRAYPALELLIAAGHEGPAVAPDTAWSLLEAVAGEDAARAWPPGLLLVASALARAGLEDSARSVGRRARAAASDYPEVRYYGANLHLLLGARDRALEDLRAYLDAQPGERAYVAHDWWWKPLRPDSEFRALVGEFAAGDATGQD